jgi:putative DNA primase/helicase
MSTATTADRVRELAGGHWFHIATASGIPEAVLRNRHGPCPGCGGRDRFRFDDKDGRGTFVCSQGGGHILAGDGFALLCHAHGWSFTEALRFVAQLVDGGGARSNPTPRAHEDVAAMAAGERGSNSAAMWDLQRSILGECRSIAPDGPVARYLANRGLSAVLGDLPSDLVEHACLRRYEGLRNAGEHPAIVAVVRGPGGEHRTLHRTYLTHEGMKAPVPSPRMLMPPIVEGGWLGGAIRLYPAETRLAVAEGIESALAVRVATGWPVWSGITAAGLGALVVPPEVREIRVHADHDEAGLRLARKLADRLAQEGRDVRLIVPPRVGMDPLDSLNAPQEEVA